jgi:hypothetical protein
MTFLRVIGLVIALTGLGLLLYSIVAGTPDATNTLATYGLFGMLAGLLLAMAADAGQKVSERQNAPKGEGKKDGGKEAKS